MKKRLIRILLLLIVITGGGWYVLGTMIESFIFFPEKGFWQRPEEYGLQYEDVYPVTEDGIKLHGWYLKANPSHETVLMFHGNAGNISHRLFKIAPLVRGGISFLLIDYRGFGQSEGRIKKGDDLYSDARAALKWLKEEKGISSDQIFLFGESIGSAPTLQITREEKVRGVILEAPFTTLKKLGKKHYPFLPDFLVNKFAFDNIENIHHLNRPLLVIHGEADDICPHEMGKRLYEEATSEKEFYPVPNAGHNDLVEMAGREYFKRIREFVVGSH